MLMNRVEIQKLEMASRNKSTQILFERIENNLGIKRQKFNDGIEYEIKLDCLKEYPISKINTDISNILTQFNYYVIHCDIYTEYNVDYHTDGEYEYSVFIYEDSLMLKIKKHQIINNDDAPIMKSIEKFDYNIDSINSILSNSDIKYIGNMTKARKKDFVISEDNGMIFSSATTCCTRNNISQLQYEIEYYGHYEVANLLKVDEELVSKELVKIAKILIENEDSYFSKSVQTKFEFLKDNIKGSEIKKPIYY